MRRYDAVFLDAQGTLLKPKPSLSGIYCAVFRRFGSDVTDEQVMAASAAIWEEARAEMRNGGSLETSDEITRRWWKQFNTRMVARLGIKGEPRDHVEALWEVFGAPDNWELFADVLPVLAELRSRGYRLGIVSNWDSRLLGICEQLRLGEYVEFVLASAVAGMEKPDKRIFEAALVQVGVAPERAVHVGDDYHADVVGARAAGVDAVLIDRDGRATPPCPVPTIRSLLELPSLLD